jgi:hypothetical protein
VDELVVELVVDVEVDDVLVDSVGGGPIGTRSGGSPGSTKVVVVVTMVLDVDVLVEVVDAGRAAGAVVEGGGMQVGLDDEVGSVVGGAAAAPDPKAPTMTATAMAARRTTGAAVPCVSRRCTASTPIPATIARAPMSSVAPNDPPELGRLHT